ncbi:MAG: hypothetical protein AAGG01_12665, partial [Planctomycetota bacterium]
MLDRNEFFVKLGDTFQPASPIDKRELLVGRLEQFKTVELASATRGRHIAVFGERGVGKTSFGLVLNEGFAKAGWAAVRVAGASGKTAEGLLFEAFQRISLALSEEKLG